jgi:hypothetical protein
MSALDRACACANCGERSHAAEKCPALREPLKNDVFFKPAGGRPSGGGDDEAAKKLKGGAMTCGVPAVELEDDSLLQTYNEHRRLLHLL